MPYTDDSGLIYDDEGRVIGATPRSYRTPEGTWNFYPNKKGAQARMPKGPPDQSNAGYDVNMSGGSDMMQDVADMFGFNTNQGPGPVISRGNGKSSRRINGRHKRRSADPFDFGGFFE